MLLTGFNREYQKSKNRELREISSPASNLNSSWNVWINIIIYLSSPWIAPFLNATSWSCAFRWRAASCLLTEAPTAAASFLCSLGRFNFFLLFLFYYLFFISPLPLPLPSSYLFLFPLFPPRPEMLSIADASSPSLTSHQRPLAVFVRSMPVVFERESIKILYWKPALVRWMRFFSISWSFLYYLKPFHFHYSNPLSTEYFPSILYI